jgi:uncharacterized protein DUF4160
MAIYGIDPVELMTGGLPRRQQRMVEAWAELHQQDLLEDWDFDPATPHDWPEHVAALTVRAREWESQLA